MKNNIEGLFKTSEDEGREKHVPVIHCPENVEKGEYFDVTVVVGEEVPHPNTIEHHIKWIQVYADFENKPPIHVATFDLGPSFAQPKITFSMKAEENIKLYAVEYCNLHGLWQDSKAVKVV
ncbi:MAG: desulfoferrodoxin [Clostridia bacterium]|nr:desulfoferrodoxin [Clostridia bacterium]